ncbi:MAG TPA: FkbM family methyltransferase [Bacteroidota bacterium]|nr:FkbM family methyltransferase [Bacteroidota bacterium]
MNILFMAPIGHATIRDKINAIHGGYGNASFNTLKVLYKMKEEKLIQQLSVIDLSSTLISQEVVDSLLPEYDVCICVTSPLELSINKSFLSFIKSFAERAKKRYIQIVWETEGFPSCFDILFEDNFFDGYLAPSHWGCRQLMKKTEKPVFYYPHFVDSYNFNLVDINKKENEEKFIVLFVGQYTARKGVKEAFISFVRSFSNNSDCELILKISRMSNHEIDPNLEFNSLLASNTKSLKCKIKMIDESISNEDLGRLYEVSSVLLFPTRGEGFGLPIAEAMLQGLPVIYSDWSACSEVGKSPYTYPVQYSIDEAHSMFQYGYEKGLKYAVPSIHDISKKLELLYDEWKFDKKKYYEKYKQNREIIKERYGYEAIKQTILNIFEGKNIIEKIIKGYINEKTKYLSLDKTAEVGKDELGYLWILRNESFYDDILQDEVGANIEHEKEIYNYILTLINDKTEFIDIGAHVGYYSIRLADKVRKVFAFEPNPKNFDGLLINVILNNVKNINILPMALSDSERDVFVVDKGSSSLISDFQTEESITKIKTVTLDSIFSDKNKENGIIKIDTEGEELKILDGATQWLEETNNIWVIEYHGMSRDKIVEKMKIFGYKIIQEFYEKKKIVFKK